MHDAYCVVFLVLLYPVFIHFLLTVSCVQWLLYLLANSKP